MNNKSSDSSTGVWIVQSQNSDDEGRIVAVCATDSEAEKVAQELSELFPDLAYAFFSVGYRFGR